MEHKLEQLRRQGSETYQLNCSCGRSWVGYRWFVEEQYNEHLPQPETTESWWDTASYEQRQVGNPANEMTEGYLSPEQVATLLDKANQDAEIIRLKELQRGYDKGFNDGWEKGQISLKW